MKRKLLIGTRNPGKIRRWSQYFGDMFEIVSLKDCGIDMEIEESLDDLRGNSIKKARTYAELSGLLTLSEDTGFFINALGGMPGVAVRRRGGELSNEASDEEFLAFFKEKIRDLKDTTCYFDYEITIADPAGIVGSVNKKAYGHIDQEKLQTLDNHDAGYPLSRCFVNDCDGKTWFESSDEERQKKDELTIHDIKEILKTML